MSLDIQDVIVEMAKAWSEYKKKRFSPNNEILEQQVNATKRILSKVSSEDEGCLVILRGPTGSGKTEVFMTPFIYTFLTGNPIFPRMYIVEPIYALIEQFVKRIKTHVERLGIASELTIGEDHGSVTSKTYLYTAPITLTTVDSYVYGFLAKRIETYRRGVVTGRFSMPVGLQTLSYTVFDEAHLIQDEVFLSPRVVGRVIATLVCSGAVVVLSSATLPKAIRELIVNETKRFCNKEPITIDLAIQGKRNINVEYHGDVKLTKNEVSCNVRGLVVVNTIERAIELYEDLKEKCGNESRVELLHSLMMRKDKIDKLDRIEKLATGGEIEGYIVIGTQTLEVGLDFSFDTLYTELAPIDALIQRFGRICRDIRGNCTAHVYEPHSHLPYVERLVNATRDIIKSVSVINLMDISSVQNYVDQVYKGDLVEDLSSRGNRIYTEVLDYLNNLYLLSYPPEWDVYVRPSFYVTISVIQDSVAQKELKKCLDQRGGEEVCMDLDTLREHELKISIPLTEEEASINCERLKALLNIADDKYVLKRIRLQEDKSSKPPQYVACLSKFEVRDVCAEYKGLYLVVIIDSQKKAYTSAIGLDVRKLKVHKSVQPKQKR